MVEAPLPSEDPQGLPLLELPLPEPGEQRLSLPTPEVKIPIAELPMETPAPPEEWNFFSEGRLGGGSGNYILGDLSLIKLGGDPGITLRFHHNSRDGFGGAQGGEGFSLRRELLQGRLNLDRRSLSFDAAMGYREEEFGLQGVGDFDSLNLRRYTGGSSAALDVGSTAKFQLSADVDWMEIWPIGGTSVFREDILSLFPQGAFTWSTDVTRLRISGFYRYDLAGAAEKETLEGHALGGSLLLEGRLPLGWGAALEGGVVWRPGEDLIYPFSFTLTGSLGDSLFLSLTGGYRDRPYEPGALREDHFFLTFRNSQGLPTLPASLKGWEGSLILRWTPRENLLLEGEGGVGFWENMIQPDTPLPTGENGTLREAKNIFSYRLSWGWLLHPLLRLFASWEGQSFLNIDLLEPSTRLVLRFEVGGEADAGRGDPPPWGGHIEGAWEVYGDGSPYASQYPRVEISGYYEAAPGIRLIAEAKDLLEPLIGGGRLAWGNFKAPGLSVALLVGLSL